MVKRILAPFILMLTALSACGFTPKHDFRGAWIQTIFQGYEKRSTAENKEYLTQLLDQLKDDGINAVIFQVRPRADAFYRSEIEPWSQFLTGTVGKAPSPMWDPLAFMVEECHKRGMELHAWLNPYRAPTVDEAAKLPTTHLLKKYPERFVKYGKGYYFKPSRQDNRDLICEVVADIIERYDVDGIHFDDYFYPYPIAGQKFPDADDYARAKTKLSRADWRRENVDKLIEQVSRTITQKKPWVRFGISPFGIWRNASSDSRGSKTRGLQNFDDLYADVPRWAEKGWIDYQIPQLYWELDHSAAPYRELCPWWAENAFNRHIYIGQDAEKTVKFNELDKKMELIEPHHGDKIHGNCWWYAASLPKLSKQLRVHYSTLALVPEYIWKEAEPVARPTALKMQDGKLSWKRDANARKWVVYRFDSKNHIDIDNPAAICGVVYSPAFIPQTNGFYVVTALDCANGESSPSQPLKVTL